MISKRHWIMAGALAISMHAAAFYAVFYSLPEGSQGAGEQGIEFDLGMMGDMGDAAQSAVAQDDTPPPTKPVEKVVKKEPPKPVEQKPKPVEKKPEPKVKPQVVKAPTPDPVVKKVEPKPEPVVKKVEPKVVTKPSSVVKQTSPIQVAKAEPKSEPKPPQEPVKEMSKPVAEKAPTEKATTVEPQPSKETNSSEVAAASSVAPHKQGPESQAAQKATTGSASSTHNGGNPGAQAKYFAKLAAALAQNKRYPRASRRRNEEGVVTLSFVAHANGEVSDARITKSSGFARLDKAVLEMLKRATPLPAFSKDMAVSQLTITLPVSFKLSDY